MILSVLIISHNQKELLQRCIESVLQQNLPFEYEIIISDDASTDGTWELAQEYAVEYKQVKAFQCNSDDCNPTFVGERAGYNRSNAYNHSAGKYFCHIDGDDFYRPGADCLQQMVNLLENRPNCSICMQNGWVYKEGTPIESGHPYFEEHFFKTGETLSPEKYLTSGLFVNNGAMMMRRNGNDSPALCKPKWYDDSVITNYYLQFGDVVCLDCTDWIYVKSTENITKNLSLADEVILWNLDATVFSSMLVPTFTKFYYTAENISGLKKTIKTILRKDSLSNEVKGFCRQFKNTFIYQAAARDNLSLVSKLRLHFCLLYCIFLIRLKLENSPAVYLLNRLCGA